MMTTTRIAMMFAGAGLIASGAQAGTITPVQAPDPQEKNHEEIFEDIFGGDFVQNGNDFSNGPIDLFRVDDDEDQSYDLLSWTAEILASWAFAGQGFGTAADGELIAIPGKQYEAATGSVSDLNGGAGIEFVRFGSEFGTIEVSTNPLNNPNGVDHVVTYRYEGVGESGQNEVKYFLFFEDANETSDYTDFDYNDLVIEITGTPVPEPGSLALLGLGGLALLRRRR